MNKPVCIRRDVIKFYFRYPAVFDFNFEFFSVCFLLYRLKSSCFFFLLNNLFSNSNQFFFFSNCKTNCHLFTENINNVSSLCWWCGNSLVNRVVINRLFVFSIELINKLKSFFLLINYKWNTLIKMLIV